MPWYAMGLSIMATQASAITFIATTGQAYVDGMRFVQFYFGLPIAMVILSATAVPIFHKSGRLHGVRISGTALRREDARAGRHCVSHPARHGGGARDLCARHRDERDLRLAGPVTTLVIGVVCVLYTTMGGIKAVMWTDVLQMSIIFFGLILGLITVVSLMPHGVSFADAVYLAGAVGKLNAVDLHFDPNNRYNLWSGLIGGAFLALGYFGCDQSQVQRYLTGKSVAQSRLSLLFNAMAKVPMQFFILFVGAMVFVFYLFIQPPMLFEKTAMKAIASQPAIRRGAAPFRCRLAEAPEGGGRGPERGAQTRRRGKVRVSVGNEYRAAQKDIDRRAPVRHSALREVAGPERVQRHQLHLSDVRDEVLSRGRCGAGDRRYLHGRDVVQFGRIEFAGCGQRDGSVPPALPEGGFGPSLPAGFTNIYGGLGRVGGDFRPIR
jgi:hypothetical protein